MLSNNNQLSLGGRGQRQRGTVRVNEPAYGFFVTGSSILAMNGVYVRKNAPKVRAGQVDPRHALYYTHEEGVWHMALNELENVEEDSSSDEDEHYKYYYRPPKKKKPTHEWVFLDEFNKPRFTHDGDTIVPGAGVRWSHYHPKPESNENVNVTASNKDSNKDSDSDSDSNAEEEEENAPASSSEVVEENCTGTGIGNQLAEIKEDDEEELPWQVIAILDWDMVEQLLYSSECQKRKVKNAKAGRNAPQPTRASLEGCFAPGRWLFRVSARDGVLLHTAADDESEEAGSREIGEYVRGVKLSPCGEWLCLDSSEDTSSPAQRRGGHQYYNAEFSRRQIWVRVCNDSENMLEEVSADETAVLNAGDCDPAVGPDGSGSTGDLIDKPFIPRMEDGDASQVTEDSLAVLGSGEEDPLLKHIKGVTSAMVDKWGGVPVGSVVEIQGLRSRAGMGYNGVTGVVVSAVYAGSGGRQGVRLDAPFSGKLLACKPDTLVYFEEDDDELENGTNTDVGADRNRLNKAASLLGLPLAQLGLALAITEDTGEGEGDGKTNTKTKAPMSSDGWGFAGLTPEARVGTAVRAAIRDIGNSFNPSAYTFARDASQVLLAELVQAGGASEVTPVVVGRAPEVMLRCGALGPSSAAAVVSAFSPLNADERDSGLTALRLLIRQESARARLNQNSITIEPGEDSGGDELLLRLALVQALLEGRRESEALEEVRMAVRYEQSDMPGGGCAAVNLLLGRCLLRLGLRDDGISALERAEAAKEHQGSGLASFGSSYPTWLGPIWEWGSGEAGRLLLAHRAAEKCRTAAVDTYARGSFEDAASLFGRGLALLQAGCCDDKRGRASFLTDRAGCLRRARKLDAAIVDLDSALRLFPRHTRALFRRAACYLEAGKAGEAVSGFKDLYRVDRDWPGLSDWMVRAYSLQKRQARGYKGAEPCYADTEDQKPKETPDADVVSREVDHYAVLGVSTDATEKQLKTAYRMRSLKFHPDRKEGNTAAFQRIAEAYQVLSDPEKRQLYDEGGDIKVKRGKRDADDSDDSEDEDEHKTNMREEVEREFYPERYHFWPFGDPFIYKRKRQAQKKAKENATNSNQSSWERDGW